MKVKPNWIYGGVYVVDDLGNSTLLAMDQYLGLQRVLENSSAVSSIHSIVYKADLGRVARQRTLDRERRDSYED